MLDHLDEKIVILEGEAFNDSSRFIVLSKDSKFPVKFEFYPILIKGMYYIVKERIETYKDLEEKSVVRNSFNILSEISSECSGKNFDPKREAFELAYKEALSCAEITSHGEYEDKTGLNNK